MDGTNKFWAEPYVKGPKSDIVPSIISANPSDLSTTVSSQREQESKR